MNVYMPAFYLGVREELEKQAFDVGSMPTNENILPNIKTQAKWKYARTKDGLNLSDGNLVYGFKGFPEKFPSQDHRLTRTEDDNILNFEHEATSKGTAQIHRSSPDNIYMTLVDGSHNPTFMLQHEQGKSWRYSPTKKFIEKLKAVESTDAKANNTKMDPGALFDGAKAQIKEAFVNPHIAAGFLDSDGLASLLQGAGGLGKSIMQAHADFPVASGVGTYATSKMLGAFRDKLNPARVAESMMNPSVRNRRELIPLASAILPSAAATLM